MGRREKDLKRLMKRGKHSIRFPLDAIESAQDFEFVCKTAERLFDTVVTESHIVQSDQELIVLRESKQQEYVD